MLNFTGTALSFFNNHTSQQSAGLTFQPQDSSDVTENFKDLSLMSLGFFGLIGIVVLCHFCRKNQSDNNSENESLLYNSKDDVNGDDEKQHDYQTGNSGFPGFSNA